MNASGFQLKMSLPKNRIIKDVQYSFTAVESLVAIKQAYLNVLNVYLLK